MALAIPALAQQPSDYPTPCDASKVTNADVDRAHTVFLSGKQYLEESNYDKAISYFKDAYSIDCSRHAMLPVIATAYERKGDKGEAVRALEEYVKRAPNAADHEVIERRIKNLKDQLAREQPAPAATAASATSALTPPPPMPIAVEPIATASAAPPSPSPVPPAPAHTPAPWIVTGIGAAAALTGGILYIVGAGDISSAEKRCPTRTCPANAMASQQTGNTGRGLENVGGPLIGIGAGALVAGLLWHFLEKPTSAPPATATMVSPVAVAGYGGVAVFGRF